MQRPHFPHAEDYTEQARRFTFRFPRLNTVLIHINFWIIAHLIYSFLLFLFSRTIAIIDKAFPEPEIGPLLLISLYSGVVFGAITGAINVLASERLEQVATGVRVLIMATLYFLAFWVMWWIGGLVWNPYMATFLEEFDLEFSVEAQRRVLYVLMLFFLVSSLLLSYITQINKRFGPGVQLPILFGRYRAPRMVNRIFMFMDLRDSTTHAENLGNFKYSELIQRSFRIANRLLRFHNAEIYQYAGDEIILTWLSGRRDNPMNCIDYFFDFRNALESEKESFKSEFGFIPIFKAGVHCGPVTAIEIGEVKHDIAYHGDVINTTARIQGMCNKYNSLLLCSKDFNDRLAEEHGTYKLSLVGSEVLKGKSGPVDLYSVVKKEE